MAGGAPGKSENNLIDLIKIKRHGIPIHVVWANNPETLPLTLLEDVKILGDGQRYRAKQIDFAVNDPQYRHITVVLAYPGY